MKYYHNYNKPSVFVAMILDFLFLMVIIFIVAAAIAAVLGL